MRKKRFLEAVATLTGTTIGAGVLAMPYVISKAGVLTGLIEIVIIGIAIILINLMLGEVVLRTKGDHQLTGYAERYLGKFGKKVMMGIMIFGIYGALTAYLIGFGNELAMLFPGNRVFYSIIYFFVVAMVIYAGIKTIGKSELLLSGAVIMMIIVTAIIAISSPHFAFKLTFNPSMKSMIFPYGVIFFAYLGAVAIPEMKEELQKQKRDLRKAIIIGGLIVMAVYLLFSTVIIGLCREVTPIAPDCLRPYGLKMEIFGILFSLLAMSTSFLALGLALKEMYEYDYNMKKEMAWLLTCIIPLILFLFKIGNFIEILSIAGAVVGGIEGILIIIMFIKAKKKGQRKPEYIIKENKALMIALAALFILGIGYQILKVMNVL